MAKFSLGGSRGGRPLTFEQRMARIEKAAKEIGTGMFSAKPRDKSGRFLKQGPEGWQGRAEAVAEELEMETDWIPVSSSNVEAIRWVGGSWGLQVKFLAKKRWPSSTYEYNVGYSTFQAMLESSSKGHFVWEMRWARIPYHRIAGGRGGVRTIIYPFGGTKFFGKVRYPKKAVGPFYKHWATPGYHPPGTHKKY